jgi:hypothetical protein
MGNEKFDSPQSLSVETKITYGLLTVKILYVSKKDGTAYAISTNTSIFEYSLETGLTTNRTEDQSRL